MAPIQRYAGKRSNPFRHLLLLIVLMTGLIMSSHSAWADWGYQVTSEVRPGQKATLTVVAPVKLKRAVATFSSPELKRKKTKKIGTLSPSKPHDLKFRVPRGLSHWNVKISGRTADGVESINFEFDVLSAGQLKVKFFNEESSLEEGKLIFSCNRPVERIDLEAFGDEGESLWQDSVSAQAKGKRLLAQFSPREDTPRRLEMKVYDSTGSWMGFRVVRWYAEIPHDDVLFESGSSEVIKDELPKIKAAVEAIQVEVDKFRRAMGDSGAQVDLQLYVAGYTDTVGDRSDNLKLSQARAKSIGRVLRKLGVSLTIKFAGFGEQGQLVKTPDSTDEPRNRRAVYVVANSVPSGPFYPHRHWRSLR